MGERLAGKIALITGAAQGLGAATAELFAEQGAKVAIADVNADAGAAVARRIGAAARFVPLDVTGEAAWQAAVDDTVVAFGGLHILVNNAGIAFNTTVESSFEDWRRIHAVDLDGVFLGCKAAIPAIVKTIMAGGSGAIVNISSVSGITAQHNHLAYNSAKAGVRHLTKSVALHCARKGYAIRCNSVHPAYVDTPILDRLKQRFGEQEAFARFAKQVPLGRIAQPREIANGVLYLASDEASFTTGSELVIDGGITAM